MITITNRKVAGFEPRWAPFRGFSLLFDNPGDSVSPMQGDLLKVDCLLDGNEDLQLYEGFVQFLDEIGTPWLTNAYSFCPLPSCSYHVTVWDGLNDGNVQDVSPSYRLKLESFLRNLPGSLLTDNEFTSAVHRSPLLTGPDWSVTFKLDKLAKWGNQVLVARLMPAGQETEKGFRRIVNEREALSARFREQFKVGMRSGHTPHVTLGYFANEEYAELATPEVDRWTELAREIVGHLTITFGSIDLYGFVDMVTFFKRSQKDWVDIDFARSASRRCSRTEPALAIPPQSNSISSGTTLRATTLIACPLLCNHPSTTTNGDRSALRLASYTSGFSTTLISPPSSSSAGKAVPPAVGGR